MSPPVAATLPPPTSNQSDEVSLPDFRDCDGMLPKQRALALPTSSPLLFAVCQKSESEHLVGVSDHCWARGHVATYKHHRELLRGRHVVTNQIEPMVMDRVPENNTGEASLSPMASCCHPLRAGGLL